MPRCLIDTGVLVRLFSRSDPLCQKLRLAVGKLHSEGYELISAVQNAAEFMNVATRPAEARGGFGLSTATALKQLAVLERLGDLVCESPKSYAIWKKLVETHRITGVAMHDARLISVMLAEEVETILTLNSKDFTRYIPIKVLTLEKVLEE